jgi:hypothetical protein
LFRIGKALKNGFNLSNDGEIIKLSKGNVTLTFDKVVRTKNGFVPGIKLLQVLGDVGTSVLDSKKHARLTERHMAMKLPANLMPVKLVQLQKQGRKTSTKNGKEEVQSLENACMLTLVQSKELVLVELNFGR